MSNAFVRARRFLSYNAFATWTAILASLTLGFFTVGLIVIVGMFVDLLAQGGEVRLASDAEIADYRAWLANVADDEGTPGEEPPVSDLGLVSLAWRTRGTWYGNLFADLAANMTWTRSSGSFLLGLVIVASVIVVLGSLVTLWMHHMASLATIEAVTRLRRAVYHQTYRLGTLTLRTLGTSEALGIFTRYIEAVHDGLYTWLTVMFREPGRFVVLLAFALVVEISATASFPWLTVAFLLFAILAWMAGGRLAAYARRQERLNALRGADQIVLLQESLQVMRLVKCYLMELFNQARVERQLSRHAHVLSERHRGRALYRQTLWMLGFAAAAVLLAVLGWNVLSRQLEIGSATMLLAAWVCLYFPVWNWLQEQRTLRRAGRASAAVFAFLDRRGDVGDVGEDAKADFLQPMSQQLEFRDVSLREPGTDRPLLRHISLEIDAGQCVGIVGTDDLEKHALVYLIPRFLDPQHGDVRIDGERLRRVTLQSLRAQVALVMQHDLVFHDTVAHNIGCGDPAFTLPQIIEAAKVAHCHQFIQQLPDGYETRIGELGHKLDLSQQFRIALARAILRDPAIVIIEEPPTPLSDEAKALIDDTFQRFLPGRTTIFLPHRLSTIRMCDRLILLHEGRVAAQGTHRELVADSDLYRHLEYLEFNVFAEQV
jgi:ATP-binding cassette subfamily B protein